MLASVHKYSRAGWGIRTSKSLTVDRKQMAPYRWATPETISLSFIIVTKIELSQATTHTPNKVSVHPHSAHLQTQELWLLFKDLFFLQLSGGVFLLGNKTSKPYNNFDSTMIMAL